MKNRTIMIVLAIIIFVFLGFLFFGDNKLIQVYHSGVKKEIIKPPLKITPTPLPE